MTVGSRTVTVGGHYKDMTQELLADGMKIIVDGHVITISADQLTSTARRKSSSRARTWISLVDEKGAVEVKVVQLRRRRSRQRSAIEQLAAAQMRVSWASSAVQASFVSRVKLFSSDCSRVHISALAMVR